LLLPRLAGTVPSRGGPVLRAGRSGRRAPTAPADPARPPARRSGPAPGRAPGRRRPRPCPRLRRRNGSRLRRRRCRALRRWSRLRSGTHGPHAARRGARPRDRRGDRLVLPGRHSPLRHSPLRGGRRPTVKAMADNADHDRPTLPDAAVTEITELFEDAVAQHKTSGVTWAIVGGHTSERPVLAHGAAGHHELDRGEPTPGSTPMARDSISRIASMTKSFTAAAVLALRDEVALRLDDPAASHVPESANAFAAGGAAAPAVTIRDRLTMSSGLVTDNPWGDRQESMTREQFAATLRGGLGQVHEVGTGFEYSNTGYALLGRVIDEVAGEDHTAVIRRRFLEPLGLADTAFETSGLDSARIATGHRLADRTDATRFEAVPFDSPGVYGAMAGLYSTVDDVAVWMRFLAAADAAPGA